MVSGNRDNRGQANRSLADATVEAYKIGSLPHTDGGGGGTSDLEVQDEGVIIAGSVSRLNFTGDGVTATSTAAGVVEVNIPGGGGDADAPIDGGDFSDTYVAPDLDIDGGSF